MGEKLEVRPDDLDKFAAFMPPQDEPDPDDDFFNERRHIGWLQ